MSDMFPVNTYYLCLKIIDLDLFYFIFFFLAGFFHVAFCRPIDFYGDKKPRKQLINNTVRFMYRQRTMNIIYVFKFKNRRFDSHP